MSEFSYACGERPQPSPDARDEFVTHRRLINKLLADTTVQQARIAALEEEAGKDRARLSAVEAAIVDLAYWGGNSTIARRFVNEDGKPLQPTPTPPAAPKPEIRAVQHSDGTWEVECGNFYWGTTRWRPLEDDARRHGVYGQHEKHARAIADLLAAEGNLPEVGQ